MAHPQPHWRLIPGDCIEVMATLPDSSVDAIVTDPPYGLGFMGRAWDALPPGLPWAQECLRVLKPGGHVVAFGGTRTYHRLTCAIEDAGFEVRDCLAWMYGSGFPKSLDVSKAIDKRPGVASHAEFASHLAECRETAGLSRADVSECVVGTRSGACWNWEHHQFPEAKWWPALRILLGLDGKWEAVVMEAERAKTGERAANLLAVAPGQGEDRSATTLDVTAPATPDAEQWQGWGTALKPASAEDRESWEAGRAAWADRDDRAQQGRKVADVYGTYGPTPRVEAPAGRWPANVLLDQEAAALLDQQTGELRSGAEGSGGLVRNGDKFRTAYGEFPGTERESGVLYGDAGGASRFFYCAKADTDERNAGLSTATLFTPADAPDRNVHPTVKPIDLMRWLCRLVTPPGGTVLDPFTGSGTTGCAAVLEGFSFIGIEREAAYTAIARARLAHWSAGILEEAA